GGYALGQSAGAGKRSDQPVPSSPLWMTKAAEAFLNSLTTEQRAKATFAFDDAQRVDWHFVPKARKGIPLKELDPGQRHLASALMNWGLRQRGFAKAATIMSLEPILHEVEKGGGPVRDADLYFFTVFGDPLANKPWGWRVEGHHVSLNYTL